MAKAIVLYLSYHHFEDTSAQKRRRRRRRERQRENMAATGFLRLRPSSCAPLEDEAILYRMEVSWKLA